MEGQDLSQGPIKKQLWSLAWPMMLSVFFYTLYNLVDAYWVSKISAESIAAVSISQTTLFIMVALGMGMTVGSGVVMSMHIGAKNIKEAERSLGQSFVLAALVGLIFTILSLVFRYPLLVASGAAGAIFDPALTYYTITAAGSILFFLLMTIMFAFNAQGDTFGLTKLFAISTLVNVVLDPVMIFGYWGTPEFGIAGAAYATLISQLVFIVLAIKSLMHPKRFIRFHFTNLTFKWESVKKVLKIGIPASLTQVIFPLGIAGLTFVIANAFQETGTIAYSLGTRVEFFAFLPAAGFGFAAMAMMGQNIGAGNRERSNQAFATALKYAFLSASGLGILCALFAGYLIGAFTSDPTVTQQAQAYMWTVALSYGFLAATMVEASAFQSIGRSWPGFWIFFVKSIAVTIPLSLLFTKVFDGSIITIWLAIILGNIAASALGYFWIRRALKEVESEKAAIVTTP